MTVSDFDRIKDLYERGLWTKAWVRNAVVKGKITAEEYAVITGEAY
jgi:uncharacterized XkdX family phage protein